MRTARIELPRDPFVGLRKLRGASPRQMNNPHRGTRAPPHEGSTARSPEWLESTAQTTRRATHALAHSSRKNARHSATPAVLSRLRRLAMLRHRPADALFGLGMAGEAQGDAAGAEHAIRPAVQAQYHLSLAHQRLGVLPMAQRRWRDAAEALQTAHAPNPSLPDIETRLQHARAKLL